MSCPSTLGGDELTEARTEIETERVRPVGPRVRNEALHVAGPKPLRAVPEEPSGDTPTSMLFVDAQGVPMTAHPAKVASRPRRCSRWVSAASARNLTRVG